MRSLLLEGERPMQWAISMDSGYGDEGSDRRGHGNPPEQLGGFFDIEDERQ